METLFLLKDCSDYRCIYGVLIIKAKVTNLEVQNAIADIKSKMNDELASSYTIENNILSELPWKSELREVSEITV